MYDRSKLTGTMARFSSTPNDNDNDGRRDQK
jgi:hypothetical protein